MTKTQSDPVLQTSVDRNSPRDYAEIGAAFLILMGILFVLDEAESR